MQIGNIRNGAGSFSNPQVGRVYDIEDVAPTLMAQGGGRIPYIVVEDNNERDDCIGQIDS